MEVKERFFSAGVNRLTIKQACNIRELNIDILEEQDVSRLRDGPGWVGFCAARNPALKPVGLGRATYVGYP
jgi:hypothetical protein